MSDTGLKGCLAGSDEIAGTRTPEERLQELLGNVKDVTGKEDLVSYLRTQVLQKVILELTSQIILLKMERIGIDMNFLTMVGNVLVQSAICLGLAFSSSLVFDGCKLF